MAEVFDAFAFTIASDLVAREVVAVFSQVDDHIAVTKWKQVSAQPNLPAFVAGGNDLIPCPFQSAGRHHPEYFLGGIK